MLEKSKKSQFNQNFSIACSLSSKFVLTGVTLGAEFISAVGSAVSRRNMPIPTPTSVGISAEPCVLDGGAQKRCQRGKISRRIHFCNRIGNFRPECADSDADGSDSAGGISATHHKSFKKGRKIPYWANFLRRFHFWPPIGIVPPESAASNADTDILGTSAGCGRHLRHEA